MTGHVWDGSGLTQQDYCRDNQTVSARWRGFSDDQSYVDHYMWCVGTQPMKEDVVACRDVGMHTRSSTQLSTAQPAGTNMNLFVFFCAGHRFIAALSHTFITFIFIQIIQ